MKDLYLSVHLLNLSSDGSTLRCFPPQKKATDCDVSGPAPAVVLGDVSAGGVFPQRLQTFHALDGPSQRSALPVVERSCCKSS